MRTIVDKNICFFRDICFEWSKSLQGITLQSNMFKVISIVFPADTLPYLIQASILLDEGVAPTLLQLLQCALCGVKGHGHTAGSNSSSTSPIKVKSKKEKESVKIKTDGEYLQTIVYLTFFFFALHITCSQFFKND